MLTSVFMLISVFAMLNVDAVTACRHQMGGGTPAKASIYSVTFLPVSEGRPAGLVVSIVLQYVAPSQRETETETDGWTERDSNA